jgi:hypothetical protein
VRKLFVIVFLFSCSTEFDQTSVTGSIKREEFFINFKKISGEGILTDRHSCLGRNELLTCELQSKDYIRGSIIEVWAFPFEGYKFIRWSGSYDTNDNPLIVFVDSEKDIIAEFSN